MYDLIGPIAIEGEGGNHLLLSGAHLRQHGSREEFLAALRCRTEHGYFLNIRELLHHCEHADTDARLRQLAAEQIQDHQGQNTVEGVDS
jgi:hypothetical protein